MRVGAGQCSACLRFRDTEVTRRPSGRSGWRSRPWTRSRTSASSRSCATSGAPACATPPPASPAVGSRSSPASAPLRLCWPRPPLPCPTSTWSTSAARTTTMRLTSWTTTRTPARGPLRARRSRMHASWRWPSLATWPLSPSAGATQHAASRTRAGAANFFLFFKSITRGG